VSRSLEFESRNERFTAFESTNRFTAIQAGSLLVIAVLVGLMASSLLGGGRSTSLGSVNPARSAGAATAHSGLQPGQVAALQSAPAAVTPPSGASAVTTGQTLVTPQPQSNPAQVQPSVSSTGGAVVGALQQRSGVAGSPAPGVIAAPSSSGGTAPASHTQVTPALNGTAGAVPGGQSAIGGLARSGAIARPSADASTTPTSTPADSTTTGASTTDSVPAAVPAGAVIGLATGNYTPGGLLVGEGGFIGAGTWQENVAHPGDVLAYGGGSLITYDVTTGQYVATASVNLGYDPTKGYVDQ
jgi:hypothetical protein